MSTSNQLQDNNISFSLEEEDNDCNFDMNTFLDEIENVEQQHDNMVPYIIDYHENFTGKELLVICDYYGIKAKKCKKNEIVQRLVEFETNYDNYEIVSKRKNVWFYMNELKNDKFMKKYILW